MTTVTTHPAAMSRIGHALADPTRARILLALRQGDARPSDLATDLGVTRQSMSNHLSCLRGCHLVSATRTGRESMYGLSDPAIAAVLDGLLSLSRTLDPTCCSGAQCTC